MWLLQRRNLFRLRLAIWPSGKRSELTTGVFIPSRIFILGFFMKFSRFGPQVTLKIGHFGSSGIGSKFSTWTGRKMVQIHHWSVIFRYHDKFLGILSLFLSFGQNISTRGGHFGTSGAGNRSSGWSVTEKILLWPSWKYIWISEMIAPAGLFLDASGR